MRFHRRRVLWPGKPFHHPRDRRPERGRPAVRVPRVVLAAVLAAGTLLAGCSGMTTAIDPPSAVPASAASAPPRSVPAPSPSPARPGSPSPAPSASPSPAPIVLAPTAFVFMLPGQALTLLASEAGYAGPFTVALQGCAGIVAVAPTSGRGPFTLTSLGPGRCSVAVADASGETAIAPVTVSTISIPVQ